MLVYPLCFYAVNGMKLLTEKRNTGSSIRSRLRSLGIKEIAMLSITFSLGTAYLMTPVMLSYAKTSVPSLTGGAFFSVAPIVPYEDVDDLGDAFEYVNSVADSNSCLILHHAFLSWGEYHLSNSRKMIIFDRNITAAVETASDNECKGMLFIWWNVPIGWYNFDVPAGFVDLADFGRISVFQYRSD